MSAGSCQYHYALNWYGMELAQKIVYNVNMSGRRSRSRYPLLRNSFNSLISASSARSGAGTRRAGRHKFRGACTHFVRQYLVSSSKKQHHSRVCDAVNHGTSAWADYDPPEPSDAGGIASAIQASESEPVSESCGIASTIHVSDSGSDSESEPA